MTRLTFAVFAAIVATPALAEMPVSIPFAAETGSQPFSCAQTYIGLGATNAEVTVVDFRMFASNAALIRADGTKQPITLHQNGQWQLDGLAMLDLKDATGGCTNGTAATNITLRGTVPDGDCIGLSFTVGVPFDQNHVHPTLAASPLNPKAVF
jgi:hypothetical protein